MPATYVHCASSSLLSLSVWVLFIFDICNVSNIVCPLKLLYSSLNTRNSTLPKHERPRPVATSCLINLSRADLACPPHTITVGLLLFLGQERKKEKYLENPVPHSAGRSPMDKRLDRNNTHATDPLLCMGSPIQLQRTEGPVVAHSLPHADSYY